MSAPFPWLHLKRPIYDGRSGWYKGWYFNLRLEEELARSIRYNLQFSLVSVILQRRPRRLIKADGLNSRLATIARNGLRVSDIPGHITERELAVLLPQTAAADAVPVRERLAAALEEYQPVLGISSYPDDGSGVSTLVAAARHRAIASAGSSIRRVDRSRVNY